MSDGLIKRLRHADAPYAKPTALEILTDEAADLIEQQAVRIAALEAQIATVAPAVDAQPVAWLIERSDASPEATATREYADLTRRNGSKVTPLYASAQSEGLSADLSLRALYEDACIQANKNAQDAARWRYAVRHWLDEHIATKQADEAIAALSQKDPQ